MRVRDLSTARRYARALLDVARQQQSAEATNAALRAAADGIMGNPALAAVLMHPTLDLEKKRAVMREVVGASAGEALVGRLIDLLMTRGRLDILPAAADAFSEEWNAARGVVTAQAVTAAPLTKDQQERLAAALSAAAGATVELAAAVDPRLLGGVRVTMAGRIYDGTVRGRLQGLRRHLEGDR
jgi:F-type H+-transporting ATPase subunit delta